MKNQDKTDMQALTNGLIYLGYMSLIALAICTDHPILAFILAVMLFSI